MSSISSHLLTGLFLRLAMVIYGNFQDESSQVKYTDIDYSVYSDAAAYVLNGTSPYRRETYRYTPLLAFMLTPIHTFNVNYGKFLFILFDLLAAYLIHLILKTSENLNKEWAYLWIYNPLPIVIATRGSSEAVIITLVLGTIYFYQNRALILSGICYGLALHFKPYVLPFCLPLYLAASPIPVRLSSPREMMRNLLTVTPNRVAIVLSSVISFALPTLVFYFMYGWEFIDETYLYHVSRVDVRHNFSIYFYLLYLNSLSTSTILISFIKIACFIPQGVILVFTALLFPKKDDLPFTFFVQVYSFVIFNKVITSQYFLWYLSLLPILAPRLDMKKTHGIVLVLLWYFIQGAWLLPAYFLEFEGRNTFMYIWVESIAFFCGNIGILVQVIKSYS